MKLIQSNCRAQFAAEDIEFILSVLGGKIGTAECLIKLLSDEESRDRSGAKTARHITPWV